MEAKNSVNDFWIEYEKIKKDFFSSFNVLSSYNNLNFIINESFNDPTGTTNCLELLQKQEELNEHSFFKLYTDKVIEVALTGSITNIILARFVLLKADRAYLETFFNDNLDNIISTNIKLDEEEWVYRRLIELFCILLFNNLKNKVIKICKESKSVDLQELVAEFCCVM